MKAEADVDFDSESTEFGAAIMGTELSATTLTPSESKRKRTTYHTQIRR